MFDVGDQVKTNEDVSRTGKIHELTVDGRFLVCFDAAGNECALFTAAQLTLVQDEPEPAA